METEQMTSAAQPLVQPEEPALLPQEAKRPRRKRRWGKIVLIAIALLAALSIAGGKLMALVRGKAPTYVQTQAAAAGEISQTLSTTGTLRSDRTAVVTSPVTAPLSEVLVQSGQIVRQGDALCTYDTRLLQRAYRQTAAAYESGQLKKSDALTTSGKAEAAMSDAAANLNNLAVQKDNAAAAVASLTEKYAAIADKQSAEAKAAKAALDAAAADLASQQQQLAAAKTAYDATEKSILTENARRELELGQVATAVSVESAKEDLNRAREGVSAPIGGVITALNAVQGGSAAAYAPLCTIQSLDEVSVDVALSRYDLAKVKLGQTATVTTLGKTYAGRVAWIDGMATSSASAAGTPTAYVHARIKLDRPDTDIKLGLEANVVIATGHAAGVLSLPVGAINTDVTGQFCYAVENGIAVRRDVTTGLSSDTLVEILSGLEEGTEVILDPQNITAGMAVSSDASRAVPASSTARTLFS